MRHGAYSCSGNFTYLLTVVVIIPVDSERSVPNSTALILKNLFLRVQPFRNCYHWNVKYSLIWPKSYATLNCGKPFFEFLWKTPIFGGHLALQWWNNQIHNSKIRWRSSLARLPFENSHFQNSRWEQTACSRRVEKWS